MAGSATAFLRNMEARARPSTGLSLHFCSTNSMSASVASFSPQRKPAAICLAGSSVSFSARLGIVSASKAEFYREWLEKKTSLSQNCYGVSCEYDQFRTVWCILLHGAQAASTGDAGWLGRERGVECRWARGGMGWDWVAQGGLL